VLNLFPLRVRDFTAVVDPLCLWILHFALFQLRIPCLAPRRSSGWSRRGPPPVSNALTSRFLSSPSAGVPLFGSFLFFDVSASPLVANYVELPKMPLLFFASTRPPVGCFIVACIVVEPWLCCRHQKFDLSLSLQFAIAEGFAASDLGSRAFSPLPDAAFLWPLGIVFLMTGV